MKLTRRSLMTGTVGGLASTACRSERGGDARGPGSADHDGTAGEIARATAEPVLRKDLFPEPVILESMELLRNGEEILVRVRSKDGAEGVSYVRATRVARMAAAAGMTCTPHMSGWGLGYLNALHFVSFIPNPAPHLEFKGLSTIPFQCDTSPLACVDGVMRVPSGPGFGIDLDPDWVRRAEVITSAV